MRRHCPNPTDRRGDDAPAGTSNRWIGGAAVVTVVGEVDLHTAPAVLTSILDGLTSTTSGICVVDLTGVRFLGADGLAALVEANHQAHQRRTSLRIVVDGTRAVIRPIEVTGLDNELALYHSVEEALAAKHRVG